MFNYINDKEKTFFFFNFKVLLTPPDEGPRVKGLRIKLQDIVDGEYTPLRVNGTWIGGKINLYKETYIIWDIQESNKIYVILNFS